MTQSLGADTLPRVGWQQGTLSRSVLAHEGDAVFFVDYEGYVTEQGGAAKLYGQSVYAYHIYNVIV